VGRGEGDKRTESLGGGERGREGERGVRKAVGGEL